VGGGRGGAVRSEDGVGEFEEGVFPAVEAFVERAAEGTKSIGRRFHGVSIMHPPRVFRYAASGLKTQAKSLRQ
jgi:hypothetical protein